MLQKTRFLSVEDGKVVIDLSEINQPMANSGGLGKALVSLNEFGADLIYFSQGKGVQNHTHEGDHILFTLSGTGYVIFEGEEHELEPGVCYLVPGNVDHAIKAETDLVLIACGNKHFPVDSPLRMTPVPYRKNMKSSFRMED